MRNKKIKWGIVGTGKSAYNFAKALSLSETGKLIAVASRSDNKAKDFANFFNLPLCFSTYKALSNSLEVDIVYIATPNSCHKGNAELFLKAGKNVLIEKPFTTNVKDAEILANLAKKHNLFLMEAMWTRFVPIFDKIESLINSNEIGEILAFHGSIGQSSKIDEKSSLFKREMGGGATLDLGVYLIYWAYYIFGRPTAIQSNSYNGGTNVDLTTTTILSYGRGKYAQIASSIVTRFSNGGIIYGTKGSIEINHPLYCPTSISICKYPKADTLIEHDTIFGKILTKIKHNSYLKNIYFNYPFLRSFFFKKSVYMPIKGSGLQYMVEGVSRYLLNDNTINKKMISIEDTLAIMEIIDKINSTSREI